jgi:molybdopterin synthase catalytic subunit
MIRSMSVRITKTPIDPAAETVALSGGRGDVGALVTFSGICRGEEDGKPIAALVLEHYTGMAEEEIARHVEEAKKRWPLLGVRIAHRVGRIQPGEIIVFVATASAHRQAAFAAAEFLMDYLKTRAPFWKKVERADGTDWITARRTDDSAAERWKKPSREAAE